MAIFNVCLAGSNLRSKQRSTDPMAETQSPQRGPGAQPRWELGRQNRPESESLLAFKRPMKAAHLLD